MDDKILFGYSIISKLERINYYFRPETVNRHAYNMYVEGDAFKQRLEAQKQLKERRQLENEDFVKAVWEKAAEDTTLTAAVENITTDSAVEIDSAVDCLHVSESLTKKRIIHLRLMNWESIAKNGDIYGNYSTFSTF